MSDKSAEIVQAAARHTESVVLPGVATWESSTEYPRDAASAAARDGLLGLYCPPDQGGQGLSFAEGIPVFEELAKAGGLYAFSLSMHNIVTYAICGFAAPPLRAHWAPRLTAGASLATRFIPSNSALTISRSYCL